MRVARRIVLYLYTATVLFLLGSFAYHQRSPTYNLIIPHDHYTVQCGCKCLGPNYLVEKYGTPFKWRQVTVIDSTGCNDFHTRQDYLSTTKLIIDMLVGVILIVALVFPMWWAKRGRRSS